MNSTDTHIFLSHTVHNREIWGIVPQVWGSMFVLYELCHVDLLFISFPFTSFQVRNRKPHSGDVIVYDTFIIIKCGY